MSVGAAWKNVAIQNSIIENLLTKMLPWTEWYWCGCCQQFGAAARNASICQSGIPPLPESITIKWTEDEIRPLNSTCVTTCHLFSSLFIHLHTCTHARRYTRTHTLTHPPTHIPFDYISVPLPIFSSSSSLWKLLTDNLSLSPNRAD